MRIRLLTKSKFNNYTESCMINEADGWRGRNVWYLGRSVRYALKAPYTPNGTYGAVRGRRLVTASYSISMNVP